MATVKYESDSPEYQDSGSENTEAEKFRKLFIGGLSYETTDLTLREFFEKWGEVVDCVVMKDQQTKRSRGFGFVTYKTSRMVDLAQAERPHRIDNREVETKRAMPRDAEHQESTNKMFLGGLRTETTEEEVKDALKEFGEIDAVDLIKDRTTGNSRGFGFVTFKDSDMVDKCVLKKSFKIRGRFVEVKKALTRKEMSQGGGGRGGGRGGRGGGPNRFGGGYMGGGQGGK